MDPSRITIRRFSLSDAGDLYAWASNARVTRYLRWGPLATQQEALQYIERVAIPHPWRRSICLDGRSIGYVSVRPGNAEDSRCRAMLSYAVAEEYWGKGVCTAALRAAIPTVMEAFPEVVRIEAVVEAENTGSQRVLEKVGFVKEGLLRKFGYCKGEIRDMFIFSFLSSDELGCVSQWKLIGQLKLFG